MDSPSTLIPSPRPSPAPLHTGSSQSCRRLFDKTQYYIDQAKALQKEMIDLELNYYVTLSPVLLGAGGASELKQVKETFVEARDFLLKRGEAIINFSPTGTVSHILDLNLRTTFWADTTSPYQEDPCLLKKAQFTPLQFSIASLFGVEALPLVDPTTKEIAWDMLPDPPICSSAPKLMVSPEIFEPPHVALELVNVFKTFVKSWKSFYDIMLQNDVLFSTVCHRLMVPALRVSSLDEEFERKMEEPQYKAKGWQRVERCLYDLLHLDDLKATLNADLMDPIILPGESMDEYCTRISRPYEYTENESFELRLIRVIYDQLTEDGRHWVLEYFGSLEEIKDPRNLLRFLRGYPSFIDGPRVDNTEWHRMRFGPQDNSLTRPPPPPPTKKSSLRSSNRKNTTPYSRPSQPAAHSGSQSSSVTSSLTCANTVCVALGYTHPDRRCPRHTNKPQYAKFVDRYNKLFDSE
ncbi:hypothetical protein BGW41_002230 [Actinomortierella wolfii]|nr:hypothetical protein BGW41_002230 [Actinomortierella wolfii]